MEQSLKWNRSQATDSDEVVYVLNDPGSGRELARVWGSGARWWQEIAGVITRYYVAGEAMMRAREAATPVSDPPAQI